jgi:shikimate dehydrogenase
VTEAPPIRGDARIAFIAGDPVAQVRTPAIFNAWAASTGADAVMLQARVSPERLGDSSPRCAGSTGVSAPFGTVVTYPKK